MTTVIAGVAMVAAFVTACRQIGGGVRSAVMDADSAMATLLGHTVDLPKSMDYWKVGKRFLWLSDNGADVMRNICIYSYEGMQTDTAAVAMKRDSVMKANLPGERSNMYMRTVRKAAVTHRTVDTGNRLLLRSEGLWEMEGDAMGGPFVCYSWADTDCCRIVVAEAFVYAPGHDKQQTMRRLERELLRCATMNHKE